MPRVGFEPTISAGARLYAYALGSAATGTILEPAFFIQCNRTTLIDMAYLNGYSLDDQHAQLVNFYQWGEWMHRDPSKTDNEKGG